MSQIQNMSHNQKMSQIQKMSQCGPSKMTWTKKLPKCKKWWNGLSAEGAKANVRSALHSADDPPFFAFLSFSCIYVCCGSMCSTGSMWAQPSYSAVLHLHQWWYYFLSVFLQSTSANTPGIQVVRVTTDNPTKPDQKKNKNKKVHQTWLIKKLK